MTKPQDQEQSTAAPEADAKTDALPNDDRREALKKLAKYSAYSAPALLALLRPAKAIGPSSFE